jgi:hypothetical protein
LVIFQPPCIYYTGNKYLVGDDNILSCFHTILILVNVNEHMLYMRGSEGLRTIFRESFGEYGKNW